MIKITTYEDKEIDNNGYIFKYYYKPKIIHDNSNRDLYERKKKEFLKCLMSEKTG